MNQKTKSFYWSLGNRIREFRIKRKYTVEQLAERADISTKHMYQIENGSVSFSTEILYKISQALNVSSSTLLFENDLKDDIGNILFDELVGKFSDEEKNFIKKVIIKKITENI